MNTTVLIDTIERPLLAGFCGLPASALGQRLPVLDKAHALNRQPKPATMLPLGAS
jgi:hypothetical protein